MSNLRPPMPGPDPFQVELATLVGLDPAQVIDGTLAVSIERDKWTLTAEVSIPIDPDAVTRLAMKYDRIRPVTEVPA